ncbi:hypothetical protein [uncultured Lentibacter sp.]|uniref:hypothetical protein n=1 Tax=uncultured Lentibacter sp. TaxID=1659309 RepID=UPI00261EA19A|nr:hypothetical protein [uncultured Lentibacter sp.]
MMKLIAVINVVAWAGFWSFGYIALSAGTGSDSQITTAAILAAFGAGIGLWTYFQLVRHAEETGYAKRSNRVELGHQEPNGESV